MILLPVAAARLAIGLHAQAAPTSDLIVGSVMTTSGLARALERDDRVSVTQIFYPFQYETLENWDLFIIEGWVEMLNAVIHEVRRLSPRVKVLYWCLDPDFPGLGPILSLDVDGYMTNSARTEKVLSQVAPTALVMLAADEAPPRQGGDRIVYVGSALGLETKQNLVTMLKEADEFGLDLWGKGWGDTDLKENWRGVLPHGQLTTVYSKAYAILGATMDGQREAGMINNRVFEALASGTPLIQEAFPELNDTFAGVPNLLLWNGPGDVKRRMQDLRTLKNASQQTVQQLREHHSYDARAKDVLAFYATLPDTRHSRLSMAVVAISRGEPQFKNFEKAVAMLDYDVSWIDLTNDDDLLSYDVVAAAGALGGVADRRVRRLTADFTLPRRLHQRRLLVLVDVPGEASDDSSRRRAADVYDAVCFASSSERPHLEALGFRPLALQDDCFGLSPPPVERTDVPAVVADAATPVDSIVAAVSNQHVVVHLVAETLRGSRLRELKRALPATAMLRVVDDVPAANHWRIPHPPNATAVPVPGEWAALAAATVAGYVEVHYRDNYRLMAAIRTAKFLSIDHYARQIQFAVTRALCLGRATSRVTLSAPVEVTAPADLALDVRISGFVVGRDGSWCLVASPGGIVACVLQHQLRLVLRIPQPPPHAVATTVSFHAELKSNLYSDVLLRSNSVDVHFVPDHSGQLTPTSYPQTEVLLWSYEPSSWLFQRRNTTVSSV